ncbi:hypothetical protein P3X46_019438 [Hevea brasiliensis]|uniref:EamA domain-containing protein n=1 Tax=Hevea brasiliensis TaxID=3981 RepID=A0ABQ9LKP8_HEVBR|nr:hypothetical protein P3X46_019438 [Hevea brasiliensis]
MARDIEKIVAVGLVWGATNALIRRGALLWDQRPANFLPLPQTLQGSTKSSSLQLKPYAMFSYFGTSATFFALLSNAPISLAVPIANATTFTATALFGMLLAEETRIGFALLVRFLLWLVFGLLHFNFLQKMRALKELCSC